GDRNRLQHRAQRARAEDQPGFDRIPPLARGAVSAAIAAGAGVTGIRSVILGCGGYLPEKVLTNADLAKLVDTSDEWIEQRTGIRERHVVSNGEVTSDLATAAARRALTDAGLDPADIDLIVLATTTPDCTFPAAAVTVQEKLGMTNGAAFDLQAVCSGFVYALTTADAMIKAGQA